MNNSKLLGNITLFLFISIHVDNYGNLSDWGNIKILDRGNPKKPRKFLGACQSDKASVKDISESIKSEFINSKVRVQFRWGNNQDTYLNNDHTIVDKTNHIAGQQNKLLVNREENSSLLFDVLTMFFKRTIKAAQLNHSDQWLQKLQKFYIRTTAW